MPVFEYKGWDSLGKKTHGVIDAEGPKSARAKLKKDGIYAIELYERSPTAISEQKWWRFRISLKRGEGRITSRDVAIATRQMSTLVGASLPLVSALNALIEQVDKENLKAVLADVREKVNEGASFADALSAHPKVFSELYVNMVRAGETSGALEVVLARLADFLESQAQLRSKITAALIYPAIMVVIGAIVLFIMITFVIPQVKTIFEETGRALPLPTRLLLGGADILTHWWWLILLLVGGAYYGFMKYIKTEEGRRKYDEYRLKLPIFGNLILIIALSRFSRTLATLLNSGVTLIRSLDIVKHVVNNVLLRDAIASAREAISEGSNFAEPLRQSRLFPPIVTHMVAIGEKTGELENMLARVADAYDVELETKISALTSVMEPVLILIMGVVIGFVVISVLLPIFQMAHGL